MKAYGATVNVPWDYTKYAASDWSNLPSIVNTNSDLTVTPINQTDGFVTYERGGNVPVGNKLFFYDKADRQIVGEFTLGANGYTGGYYNLVGGGSGMFSDRFATPEDEGWKKGDEAGVFLMDTNGNFFDAYFDRSLIFTNSVEPYIGSYDITVTTNLLGSPIVHIETSGDGLLLSWTGSWIMEDTTNLVDNTSWADSASNTNSHDPLTMIKQDLYVPPADERCKFWRLRLP